MINSPRFPNCHAPECGFTLIEVLIVLLIVALAGAVMSLQTGISPQATLEDESDRLLQTLELGLDRSRLVRRPVVFRASSDRYILEVREAGVERQIFQRELGREVRLQSIWIEGELQRPPYELLLSGRDPGFFRIRIGSERGGFVELRSTLLGRMEKTRGAESQ